MQRKRKARKGGSYSTLSLLRKELREGNLQSLFGGSQCIVSSSNSAPDPLLSSFISPLGNESASSQSHTQTETRSSKKLSDETVSRRYFFSISVTNCHFNFTETYLILHKSSWMSWYVIQCPSIVFHARILNIVYTFYSNIGIFYIRLYLLSCFFSCLSFLQHTRVMKSFISLFVVKVFEKGKRETFDSFAIKSENKMRTENISSN